MTQSLSHYGRCLLICSILMLFWLSSANLYAQSHREWMKSGNSFLKQGDYASAVASFLEAATLKPDDPETHSLLGEAAMQARNYPIAADAYRVVAEKGRGEEQKMALYYRALMLKQTGDLDGWEASLKLFADNPVDVEEEILDHAKQQYASIQAVRLLAHPDSIRWKITHAGDDLNSDFSELRPWRLDDSLVVFSSSLPVSSQDEEESTQLFFIYYSRQHDRGFDKPRFLDKRLHQEGMHTGNPSFTPDGNKMYFSVCDMDLTEDGACEIWVAERSRGKWTKVRPLGEVINIKGYSASQPAPAMLGDKEVLYFVSDRPGGQGGYDIWYSVLSKGFPTEPVNAGSTINTPGNESTPYYDANAEGLYFSSDFHTGLGGLDVFFSKGRLGKWDKPINLGKDVNSPAEDLGFIPPAGMRPGYVVSNRIGSRTLGEETCCFDIYLVEPYVKKEEPKEDPVVMNNRINQEKAARINTVLPLSLYFDNDHPDPRSNSESTKLTYGNTLDAYMLKKAEYEKQYSTGIPAAQTAQARARIGGFFQEEVLPAREKLQTLMGFLYETLADGRDVDLIVQGYASPLNTLAYNRTLASRRIRSMINEMNTWNNGALLPYLNQVQGMAKLSIREVPIGVDEAASGVSSRAGDLRNSVYSPEAARARRITILYGEVGGMVAKTTSGNTTAVFRGQNALPAVAAGQYHTSIVEVQNTGNLPLSIESTETTDPRVQVVLSGSLIAPGKTAQVYIKVEGPWTPDTDTAQVHLKGNLPGGKVVLSY